MWGNNLVLLKEGGVGGFSDNQKRRAHDLIMFNRLITNVPISVCALLTLRDFSAVYMYFTLNFSITRHLLLPYRTPLMSTFTVLYESVISRVRINSALELPPPGAPGT